MKNVRVSYLSPYTREYEFEDHKETNLLVENITIPIGHLTKEQAKTVFNAVNSTIIHKSLLWPGLILMLIRVKLEYEDLIIESTKQDFNEIAKRTVDFTRFVKEDEIILEKSFVEKCIERRSTGLFDKFLGTIPEIPGEQTNVKEFLDSFEFDDLLKDTDEETDEDTDEEQ